MLIDSTLEKNIDKIHKKEAILINSFFYFSHNYNYEQLLILETLDDKYFTTEIPP